MPFPGLPLESPHQACPSWFRSAPAFTLGLAISWGVRENLTHPEGSATELFPGHQSFPCEREGAPLHPHTLFLLCTSPLLSPGPSTACSPLKLCFFPWCFSPSWAVVDPLLSPSVGHRLNSKVQPRVNLLSLKLKCGGQLPSSNLPTFQDLRASYVRPTTSALTCAFLP